MGKQKIELHFEGDEKVTAVKLTERAGQGPLREMLLSNGKGSFKIVAHSDTAYPGTYRLMLYTAKGAKGILVSSDTSLELSTVDGGATALISVDAETDALTVIRKPSVA